MDMRVTCTILPLGSPAMTVYFWKQENPNKKYSQLCHHMFAMTIHPHRRKEPYKRATYCPICIKETSIGYSKSMNNVYSK